MKHEYNIEIMYSPKSVLLHGGGTRGARCVEKLNLLQE